MKPLVLYHAQCRDGFAAAWVASLVLGHKGADYRPVQYGSQPPNVVGRDVFILDFSYPRREMEELDGMSDALVVLDHHKTAQAELEGFACEVCVFDMERSGAGLTADYFGIHSGIVPYVEDRDLWRWKLPDSREINAWIASLPFDFKAWDEAEKLFVENYSLAVQYGKVALAKTRTYCAEVARNVRFVEFEEYQGVACVNVPQVDISEVLEGLLDSFGTLAIGWFVRADGMAQVSLRSRGDLDVSEMAKRYGGGGHKNAAGFQVGLARWVQTVTKG